MQEINIFTCSYWLAPCCIITCTCDILFVFYCLYCLQGISKVYAHTHFCVCQLLCSHFFTHSTIIFYCNCTAIGKCNRMSVTNIGFVIPFHAYINIFCAQNFTKYGSAAVCCFCFYASCHGKNTTNWYSK